MQIKKGANFSFLSEMHILTLIIEFLERVRTKVA